MAKITVINLFGNKSISPGTAGTSDPIDLRYAANNGFFSLAHSVVAGTAGTVGTTVFTYVGCSTLDGTFVSPSASVAISTAGTAGTGGTANISTFEPEPMPFMKIIATQTGAAGAGKDSKVTAELIMQ